MTQSDSGDALPVAQGTAVPLAPKGRHEILILVMAGVAEMLQDEDRVFAGPLTPQTKFFVDLGLGSLDLVMLIGHLNRQLCITDTPLERVFVANLSLQLLADVMWEQTRKE
jgi:acyl carrier protein